MLLKLLRPLSPANHSCFTGACDSALSCAGGEFAEECPPPFHFCLSDDYYYNYDDDDDFEGGDGDERGGGGYDQDYIPIPGQKKKEEEGKDLRGPVADRAVEMAPDSGEHGK